jgi:predicted HD phosphohydrolase
MKNLDLIIGDIKDSAKDVEAYHVLERCKELLSEYFEHVVVSQYANIDLSSKSTTADLKLGYYNNQLCLFSNGELLPNQKDLTIESKPNDVVTVTCDFILTKDVLNLEIDQ